MNFASRQSRTATFFSVREKKRKKRKEAKQPARTPVKIDFSIVRAYIFNRHRHVYTIHFPHYAHSLFHEENHCQF